MQVRATALAVGMAIASVTVFGAAMPSGAQVLVLASACTSTTATFVQPVGSARAPILVPMNVPVTECTLPHNVRVIVPAFQVVGTPPSIIVPSGLSVTSCTVSSVIPSATSATPVQVLTPSGSTVTVLTPASGTPVITCF